jgi:hypothetical protein
LIQKVHDKRTLHSLLRIPLRGEPLSASDHADRNGFSVKRDREELSSTFDSESEPGSDHYGKRNNQIEEMEEEGRYGIGRQRPSKIARQNQVYTVFTTDEEEADERGKEYMGVSGDSSDDEEYRAYGVVDCYGEASPNTDAVERRRSYWTSKGI